MKGSSYDLLFTGAKLAAAAHVHAEAIRAEAKGYLDRLAAELEGPGLQVNA